MYASLASWIKWWWCWYENKTHIHRKYFVWVIFFFVTTEIDYDMSSWHPYDHWNFSVDPASALDFIRFLVQCVNEWNCPIQIEYTHTRTHRFAYIIKSKNDAQLDSDRRERNYHLDLFYLKYESMNHGGAMYSSKKREKQMVSNI